ncbi:MAG: hypothetical protein ACYC9Y_16405, partial [Candidatus Methylomirabilia bacterium]
SDLVHEPSNPRHRAFRDLLAHEIFRRPPVGLFCLAPLRAQVERTRRLERLTLGLWRHAAPPGEALRRAAALLWRRNSG